MTVETMEGRTLLSVTVAEGYYGYYDVTGTESGDVIAITVDQDEQTFTLDDVTYEHVEFIFIDAGDGDDVVTVSASGLGYIGTSVVGGGGCDTISVNFDGSVWGGDGSDTIALSDSFRGEVYGEEGNDYIAVQAGCYDAVLDGGAGDDVLDASTNDDGVHLYGGAGDDMIYGSEFDDFIFAGGGEDVVFAAGGNDTIYTLDATGDLIDGGDGTDWLCGDATEGTVLAVEHVM